MEAAALLAVDRTPRHRRDRPRVAFVIAAVAAIGVVSYHRSRAAAPATMSAPSLSEKDDDDRLPYTEVKIPMSTFIAESRVRDFLASRGVGTDASQAELERYVPRKIVLQKCQRASAKEGRRRAYPIHHVVAPAERHHVRPLVHDVQNAQILPDRLRCTR